MGQIVSSISLLLVCSICTPSVVKYKCTSVLTCQPRLLDYPLLKSTGCCCTLHHYVCQLTNSPTFFVDFRSVTRFQSTSWTALLQNSNFYPVTPLEQCTGLPFSFPLPPPKFPEYIFKSGGGAHISAIDKIGGIIRQQDGFYVILSLSHNLDNFYDIEKCKHLQALLIYYDN